MCTCSLLNYEVPSDSLLQPKFKRQCPFDAIVVFNGLACRVGRRKLRTDKTENRHSNRVHLPNARNQHKNNFGSGALEVRKVCRRGCAAARGEHPPPGQHPAAGEEARPRDRLVGAALQVPLHGARQRVRRLADALRIPLKTAVMSCCADPSTQQGVARTLCDQRRLRVAMPAGCQAHSVRRTNAITPAAALAPLRPECASCG